MPAYATLILIAVIGALWLAMLAVAHRWPGDGPWFGAGPSSAGGESEETHSIAVTRQVLLTILRARFGELPAPVIARIEQGDRAWCEELAARSLTAGSLQELGLLDEPDATPTHSNAGHS
jgi:hypothetical protein